MKFKYYMRGFGAGLIAATIILMIAGKVDDNNKSLSVSVVHYCSLPSTGLRIYAR